MRPHDCLDGKRSQIGGTAARDTEMVNWVLRSLDDHQRRGDCNLVVLHIDSGGGNWVFVRVLTDQSSLGSGANAAVERFDAAGHPVASFGARVVIAPKITSASSARCRSRQRNPASARKWSGS